MQPRIFQPALEAEAGGFGALPAGWTANLRGDALGGLMAAVVSIPLSIGFGLLAFAPFGERYLSTGILAGLYGAVFLGLAAIVFGARTITVFAPRSLIAFMIGSVALHSFADAPQSLREADPLYLCGAMFATLAMAGGFQMVFGIARLGALVRFIPSPVMAGFQNAAALLILYSQLHVFLGLPRRLPLEAVAAALPAAKPLNLLLGAATVALIWTAPRFTRRLPPALIGLIFGTAVYYLLVALGFGASQGPTIGTLPESMPNGQFFGAVIAFIAHPVALEMAPTLIAAAFSVAVVASLDTLICSRIVDAMSGQRMHGNALLRMIGCANMVTSLLGGLAGGASLAASGANHKAGGRSPMSLFVHCVAVFIAVALLAPLLGRLPLVVVGAVLVIIAVQLVDPWSLQLAARVASRQTVNWRSIALDLVVIATVAATAIAGEIVIAVLIGVAVAIVLFVARMSRSIVKRAQYGDSVHSRRTRDAAETELLAAHGKRILLLELQGPMFFGSAESLADRVDAAAAEGVRYVVFDLRQVNDLDSTGARTLLQARDRLQARGAQLVLASIESFPHVNAGLRDAGVVAAVTAGRIFPDADRALEWAENHLIEAVRAGEGPGDEYPFVQLDCLAGFTDGERAAFRALLKRREYAKGEVVFSEGAPGDELYIIVRGSASVRIRIPPEEPGGAEREQRLVTFAAGTVFGEMALLDREARSATVIADEALVCYVLDRAAYERVQRETHAVAIKLLTNIGRELSARLRRANRMLNELGG